MLEGTVTTTARKPSAGSTRADRAALLVVRESEALSSSRKARSAFRTTPLRCLRVRASSTPPRPLSPPSERALTSCSKIGDFRHDETASPSRTTSFASLTRTPGTAPQPCPSPGRPTRRPPGHAVVEGSVIRRGRAESGEEWGFKHQRVPEAARATRSWWTERARCAGRSTDP